MSPATPWTEMSIQAATPYVEGIPDPTYDASLDYFIDPLFEGTGFFALIATPYTEMSIAATPYTEMSTPLTPWTEMTG